MSARELYETAIRQLSPIERLRLASLILDDLAASSGEGLDIQDEWSSEDLADLTQYSMKHAANSVPPGDIDA